MEILILDKVNDKAAKIEEKYIKNGLAKDIK